MIQGGTTSPGIAFDSPLRPVSLDRDGSSCLTQLCCFPIQDQDDDPIADGAAALPASQCRLFTAFIDHSNSNMFGFVVLVRRGGPRQLRDPLN